MDIKKYSLLLIFIAAILWASDAPFRVGLTESLSSSTIVFLEHIIALLIVTPLLPSVWREVRILQLTDWLAILFIGIGGSAVALFLFTESFAYMNPSVVILLQKLQPLIAIGLATVVLKEVLTRHFWVWTGVALAAAYVISFPTLVPQLYVGEQFNPSLIGAALALAAAFLWGASTVFGRYVLKTVGFKTMTYLRFLVGSIFLLLLTVKQGTLAEIPTMTRHDWFFMLIIAFTSGAVALYIYYRGLSGASASTATIAELGFPVGAVVVNYFFLDATLSLVQILAVAVLLFAVLRLNRITTT